MKRFLKIFTSFFMVLTLTGCMKINVDLDYSKADQPQMSMKLLYSQKMIDQYDINIDDLKNNDQLKNLDTEIIEETIDNEDYQGVQATVPQSQMSEVKKLLTKDNDTYTLTLPIQQLSEKVDNNDTYNVDQLKSLGIDLSMKVTMPGEVIKTDVGLINGNVVNFDLSEVLDKNLETITIQSEAESSNDLGLYVGIGAILVCGGLVIGITSRKKSQKTNKE